MLLSQSVLVFQFYANPLSYYVWTHACTFIDFFCAHIDTSGLDLASSTSFMDYPTTMHFGLVLCWTNCDYGFLRRHCRISHVLCTTFSNQYNTRKSITLTPPQSNRRRHGQKMKVDMCNLGVKAGKDITCNYFFCCCSFCTIIEVISTHSQDLPNQSLFFFSIIPAHKELRFIQTFKFAELALESHYILLCVMNLGLTCKTIVYSLLPLMLLQTEHWLSSHLPFVMLEI